MIKPIICLSGKASHVWKLWALIVQRYGNKTLGELVSGK